MVEILSHGEICWQSWPPEGCVVEYMQMSAGDMLIEWLP